MSDQPELIEVKITCENCKDEFDLCNMHKVNDLLYCEDCYNEKFVDCNDCNTIIEIDSCATADGNYICEGCIENYFFCESCETYHSNDDSVEVHSRRNSTIYVCEDCSSNYSRCDRCSGVFDTQYHDMREVDGNYCCEDCSEDSIYCESCDTYSFSDCDCNRSRVLHDYSYKPENKFFTYNERKSKTLFYGIELEIEGDKELLENMQKDFFYYKQDGSLDAGFELVTHPLSWIWIKKNKSSIKEMLQYFRNNSCKSHDTTTCGIHIHISRNKISDIQLSKICNFFTYNQKFVLKISQRVKENLDSWSSLTTENKSAVKYVKDGNYRRYVAINLQNKNTIEFRIFRGNLNFNSFMKNLEFINSIIEFTNVTGYSKSSDINLYYKFLSSHKNQYRNLINFIKAKIGANLCA